MNDQLILEIPGMDRVHYAPFTMPGAGASDSAWIRAIERMNTVQLTVDQFERGLEVYGATRLPALSIGAESKPIAALEAFCRAEGIEPPDVAARAILFRRNPIMEALFDHVDLKAVNPQAYVSYITKPIDPSDYGWGDDGEEAAAP